MRSKGPRGKTTRGSSKQNQSTDEEESDDPKVEALETRKRQRKGSVKQDKDVTSKGANTRRKKSDEASEKTYVEDIKGKDPPKRALVIPKLDKTERTPITTARRGKNESKTSQSHANSDNVDLKKSKTKQNVDKDRTTRKDEVSRGREKAQSRKAKLIEESPER